MRNAEKSNETPDSHEDQWSDRPLGTTPLEKSRDPSRQIIDRQWT